MRVLRTTGPLQDTEARNHRSIRLGAALCAITALVSCTERTPPSLGQPPGTPPAVVRETERLLGLALDHWIENIIRLQRVSQKIRLAGRDLCTEHLSPVLGIAVSDPDHLPQALLYAAQQRFGDAETLPVVAVYPGFAGERAGVRVGDEIVLGDDGVKGASDVYAPKTPPGEPVRLTMIRDDERISLSLDHDSGCEYYAVLRAHEVVNAWATGEQVIFTSAFMRYFPGDTELALVMGHETAHDIHFGTGVFLPVRASSYSIRAESAADYVGIYLATMAGYSLDPDPEFHLTLARNINRLGRRGYTHPMAHERIVALRETLAEIHEKRMRGEPLLPTVQ